MSRYGGCLPNCDNDCVKRCFIAATACSATAAFFYTIVKCSKGWLDEDDKDEDDKNEDEDDFYDFSPMIAVIAQMDLLYTIATSNLTGTSEVAVSITLLVIVILIG